MLSWRRVRGREVEDFLGSGASECMYILVGQCVCERKEGLGCVGSECMKVLVS